MTSIAENQPRVERVDDIPVIYGLLERMGIGAIIDAVIKAHGNWQGLSPGQVITVWLMHILSEQNHKMEPVQQWAGRRLYLLESLLGTAISEFDFTDDRLALCLRDLSKTSAWQAIEQAIGRRLLRVYDLPSETLRLDATVGSVYHEPEQPTLFAVGKAKNGQYATQFKLMMASLDPLGLPLVVDVKPGNQADDPLYVPSYQRAKALLNRDSLLVVGDSKMSARTTRGTIAAGQDSYLAPLADKKDEPELLVQLLEEWLVEEAASTPIFLPEDLPADGRAPDPTLAIACAFEVTRMQEAMVEGEAVTWEERLLVVRSYSYQQSTLASFRRRLAKAEAALWALTPPRQRGKTQIQTEHELRAAMAQIEQRYEVQGFFTYAYQQEVTERALRPYKDKPARVARSVRYQLTVHRNAAAIAAAEAASGWRLYATNAPPERLPLTTAVLTYRDQIVHENIFRRLHGKALSLTPLYVQREDHAQGLIHLLTIAVRVLALGDYLAREALALTGEALAGVYAGNPNRSTPRPTTERMLKTFEGITLIFLAQGERLTTILTQFSQVHARILAILGLQPSLFSALQAACTRATSVR